jgi:hypothetical protein
VVSEGNDTQDVACAIREAQADDQRPSLLLARTGRTIRLGRLLTGDAEDHSNAAFGVNRMLTAHKNATVRRAALRTYLGLLFSRVGDPHRGRPYNLTIILLAPDVVIAGLAGRLIIAPRELN